MFEVKEKPKVVERAYLLSVVRRKDQESHANSLLNELSELEEIIKSIFNSNPSETDRFKNGEKKLTGFFMGQIMKATKGTANPKTISQLLNQIIKEF